MKTRTRLERLEKTFNVNMPVYVIESHPAGQLEYYNTQTKETTNEPPAGAHILCRVGNIDIKRL